MKDRSVDPPRLCALLLAVVVVPAVMTLSSAVQEAPVRLGEGSPRTVVAPDLIRVVDPDATDLARSAAAEAVNPITVSDEDAVSSIVGQVRDAFATARAVRSAGAGESPPTALEQIESLRGRIGDLDTSGVRAVVNLDADALDALEDETVGIAQVFAREAVRAEGVGEVADRVLATEFAVRPIPDTLADRVVEPLLRGAFQPTVLVDDAATAAAREAATGDVAEVQRTFTRGQVIVAAGQEVDEVTFAALRSRDLLGTQPLQRLWRAGLAALVLTVAMASYLRTYRTKVWANSRTLLLIACLVTLSALLLEMTSLLPPGLRPAWSFLVPLGGVAMLATILVDPPVGVLLAVPHTVLAAVTLPGDPGIAVYAALVTLGSVPLVSRVSARGDLRRAAVRSIVGFAGAAGVCAAVFSTPDTVGPSVLAGLVSGVLAAVVLNASLPFLESAFGVCTATSLLDLADRNHPLLRKLEQSALGSYNHSIVMSTMVDRAARGVGADPLLASTQALYHDIGKTRRPYFFVENQFGIANPHDELDPRTSATIIQEHVTDGIAMARQHRLPPEVIDGIATHHGTTLVAFFHRKALAAGDDDEEHYRYKGRRPTTKETAILMLADCCEGAARAAAQANRNLSGADLENIVRGLTAERVEDGQLEESPLTFRDLAVVQRSFIETLTGVYHPRIAYPDLPVRAPGTGPVRAVRAPAPTPPDPVEPPVGPPVGPQVGPRVGPQGVRR